MKQPPNNTSTTQHLGKGVVRQHTATLKKLMVEQLQKYPVIEAACHKVGISRMTHYRWVQNDKAYAEQTVSGLYVSSDTVNDVAVSKVIDAINRGEKWAIIFWLTHRHPQFNDDPVLRNINKRIAKIEMKEEEQEYAVAELRQIMNNIVIVKPRNKILDSSEEAGSETST